MNTLSDDEILALGDQARALLENPTIMGAIGGFMNLHLQTLLATEDTDVRGREHSFRQMRAYETIVADLKARVDAAERITVAREAGNDAEDYYGDI